MFYTVEQKRAIRNTLKKACESLTTIDSSNNDILKTIRNLDPNKSHGHDVISIRMVKICDDSICKPLKLYFQSSLEKVSFLMNEKKQMWFQFKKRVASKY